MFLAKALRFLRGAPALGAPSRFMPLPIKPLLLQISRLLKSYQCILHQFYKVSGRTAKNVIELVEPRRIELLTSCVQGRRSPS